MLLNQLVQENDASRAVGAPGAAVNDNNDEPVSGVVLKRSGAEGDTAPTKTEVSAEAPQSKAEMRTQAMHRFLSAQTDVSEEVLQLYKLVCTGIR